MLCRETPFRAELVGAITYTTRMIFSSLRERTTFQYLVRAKNQGRFPHQVPCFVTSFTQKFVFWMSVSNHGYALH